METGKKVAKVAVFGASGYTGGELLRILSGHRFAKVVWAGAASNAGKRASDVFPHLRGIADIKLSGQNLSLLPGDADVIFCALPHGRSSRIMRRLLKKGARVIDLGADFRLTHKNYDYWYGISPSDNLATPPDSRHSDQGRLYGKHPAPELIREAVYGLPEVYGKRISKARLVANPGCYATGALLALLPFAEMVKGGRVAVDSKSGASGAGRAPAQETVFGEVNEAAKPYSPNSHRHIPEIEENLSKITADFTPHLLPMDRGILTTAYLPLKRKTDAQKLLATAREFYADAAFIRVLPEGACPSTAGVRGSNYCDIGVAVSRDGAAATVMTAIDNLVKGASGQAVQNMNLMLGLDETEGLTAPPLFP
ncbi:MAG: N-acetyl-gamma-glutamyl-phosphate reductase [Candidatus Dadabacteria bacterium]|nr:N-acetyl-gamma-glutamyl-phosphate reductase [Candidatus Dadabacteria bacterium]